MPKEIKDKNLVTRSNRLIGARYKLSTIEQRLVYILASHIQPTDEDFFEYTFSVSDIANFCNMDEKSAFNQIKKATYDLINKGLIIPEPDGDLHVSWLASAKYHNASGSVSLCFAPRLKPYLIGLKKQFTSLELGYLKKFSSQYSGRIYELVKSLQGQGKSKLEQPIPLDELKKTFGVEKDYKLYGDFRKRVLEPAISEINAKTPDNVTYEEIKTGRKITHIKFAIKQKQENTGSISETDPDEDDNGNAIPGYGQPKLFPSEEIAQNATKKDECKETIEKLLKNEFRYNSDVLEVILEYNSSEKTQAAFDYYKKIKKTTVIKNKAGYFRQLLKQFDFEAWEQENKEQMQKKAEAEALTAELEQKTAAEVNPDSWDPKVRKILDRVQGKTKANE